MEFVNGILKYAFSRRDDDVASRPAKPLAHYSLYTSTAPT